MNIITHLQKRIESILDHDPDVPRDEVLLAMKSFEALTDPHLLRGLSEGLPQNSTDKAVILFSRLALFFDAGVFLESDKNLWEPQAHFHRGHIYIPKSSQKKSISLPNIDLMTVLRTDAKPIFQKLNLQHFDTETGTACLFLRPGTDFSFLLFSSLPDLWLKEHIRLVTETIRRGINNE